MFIGEELISETLVEKIAGWRHSGFSVHSKVRARTKKEAERVGKYMIRPLLSLERLSFDEREGKFFYRYGEEAKHYHLDWTLLGDEGLRFENLVACHLLKWCYFVQDTEGFHMELRYFRDVDKREIDFILLKD